MKPLQPHPPEVSVPDEEPAPKAKAKRKPRAPKVVVEPEPPTPEPEPDTPEPEPPTPEPVKKVSEKETCPDCGKLVASKTLKYSHRANCKVLKQKPMPTGEEAIYREILNDPNPVGRDDRLQAKLEQIAKMNAQPEPKVTDNIHFLQAMLGRDMSNRDARLQQRMQRIAKLTESIC